MFGLKPQKTDRKSLIATIDTDLDAVADNLESLIAETGKSRQEILDACLADDEVESCREDVRTALLAASWRLWGEEADEEMINRLYKVISRHIEIFVDLALLARFNGYAVAEYIYRQEADGLWVIDQVLSKEGELDRYTPKRDGNVILAADSGDIVLDRQMKYLLLTSKAVPARPAGEMMILRAYSAVVLRKRGWAYAGQFVKRYAQPYVIGKQGGYGAIGDFVSKLFGFSNGGAAAIGKDDEISLHQLSGDGEAFALIERLANARIQKLILGRVKTSDLNSASRAAQETEEDTRQDRISAYLDLLARAVQHAVDAMIAVNAQYGRAIPAPKGLWFEYPKAGDIDLARAQRDQIYLQSGAITLTKDYYTDIVGYEAAHVDINATNHPNQLSSHGMGVMLSAAHANDGQSEKAVITEQMVALMAALDAAEDAQAFIASIAELQLPDNPLIDGLIKTALGSFAEGYHSPGKPFLKPI